MRAVLIALTALLLVGCEGKYRYECQNPENKENLECTRPACELTGFCFDTLNGIQPPQVFEESADCNCETTGE
jgi:hypothetical protein